MGVPPGVWHRPPGIQIKQGSLSLLPGPSNLQITGRCGSSSATQNCHTANRARHDAGEWRDPLAGGAKRRKNEYVCALCQVITSSQTSLEAHQKGKAHKRKVKLAERSSQGISERFRDSRDQYVDQWDGTTMSDGSRAIEPQVVNYYGNQLVASRGIHAVQRDQQIIKFYKGRKRKAADAASVPETKRSKLNGGKKMDPVAAYRRRIGLANRDGSVDEGLAAFDELHAAGLRAETKTYNSVLSLCASAGASRWGDAIRVYETYPMKGCFPDEGTYTCLIRLCGLARRLDRGLALLGEMRAANIEPKRRTYSPLLVACAVEGAAEVEHALNLMADAKSHDIELFEEDFAQLVKVCSLAGESKRLLRDVFPQMMEQCYTISRSTSEAVQAWASAMPSFTHTVASADAAGVVCGLRLRSLRLSNSEQEIMLDQVTKLAAQDETRGRHFDQFKAWLSRNGPFDVILDGANIGFSNQRVDKGEPLRLEHSCACILNIDTVLRCDTPMVAN